MKTLILIRFLDAEREENTLMKQKFMDLALEISKKVVVLLKNDEEVLPLSKELNRIAVLMPLADNKEEMLGSWSGACRAEDNVTLLEGIRNYVSEGITVFMPGASILRIHQPLVSMKRLILPGMPMLLSSLSVKRS